MKDILHIPTGHQGACWYHRFNGQIAHRHHHDELELNLVTRGTGDYLLGERTYGLRRHALVWLFPGQEHLLVNQSPDYQMWILVFRQGLVERTCAGVQHARALVEDDPAGWFCHRLAVPQAERLDLLFEELIGARDDTPRFNAGLTYALLATWDAFRLGEEIPPGATVHPAVEQAVVSLRRGDARSDLPSLAKRCGLSPGRLSRLFTAQIGMPIVEFRNRQRIERVLASVGPASGPTLLDAALDAGFGSYPQFHRVFRRVMGCSPTAYLRRSTGGHRAATGADQR
jgi:AraC-like DNA-binding protein